jgi:hypothetical protein
VIAPLDVGSALLFLNDSPRVSGGEVTVSFDATALTWRDLT